MLHSKYTAVIFDLYTALLDSWSLWNNFAGSAELGLQWRKKYLEFTYQAGRYRSYDGIIGEAANAAGVKEESAAALIHHWGALQPWPEAPLVLRAMAEKIPIAIATNSSISMANIAVACVDVPIPVVATAEESGYYKPLPQTYQLALERLGCAANDVLFVAGSASDVPGARNVGMSVYWHNRAKLNLTENDVPPQYEADSLLPLLELI